MPPSPYWRIAVVQKICIILMAGSVLILSGCATSQTTTDPRKGGLFSYNPEAYKERIDERKARQSELEMQKAEEEQKSKDLEEQVALKRSERDALAKKIAALDSDIDKIEKQIANARTDTDAQKHAQWKINTKLKVLKKKLAAAKSSKVDTKAKEREVERLKKEIDRLLEEAEALSKL